MPTWRSLDTQVHIIISVTNDKRGVDSIERKRGVYLQGGFHVVDVHGFCGHDYDMVVIIRMIVDGGVSLQGKVRRYGLYV